VNKKSEFIGINIYPELKKFLIKESEKKFSTITQYITDLIVEKYQHSLTANNYK
jgi:hypothetical protein